MTAAEIILRLYWLVMTAVWAFLVVDVIALVIRMTPGVRASLLVLIILTFVSIIFIWAVRSGWRRSLARPIPDHGIRGWFWRQPGWRLLMLFAACYLLPVIVIQLDVIARYRWPLSESAMALLASCAVFLAAGQAAGWCVRRQRQREWPAAPFVTANRRPG